ncbi:helix-turn-helix domain-containing protein [Pseudoalteromonas sp. R3]|uniref:helix-turn-helix domain-containing protein n=1 Tax=Pseudoalteromonas sp. R3 TaxID=1709477 RepID=UPI0006B5C7E1|nr:helix-turn-helix transcriptional regulator [Pseudoalteromonas sp. R3]
MFVAEFTFVYTFLLGALGLALTILAGRVQRWHCYRALALFLFSLFVILSGPLIFAQFPAARYVYIAAIVPAWLLLFPCFYLYTRGLTSQVPWRFSRQSLWHFVPACVSCVLSVSLLRLSDSTLFSIFFAEGDVELASDARLTVWLIITVMLFWPLQSLVYVVKTWRNLLTYRRQLHAVFASTKERELGWLGVVLTLMFFNWGWLALTLIQDLSAQPAFLREGGVATLTSVTIWLLLYWSLRQKPGFDKIYHLTEQPERSNVLSDKAAERSTSAKYQHSALSDEQANRIARKIHNAVVTEKLYLEPDLTLYKLAEYLKVSANYVSQTLNQTLGQSFFDYVNKARIDAATELLRANDKTVLDIAMAVGFNARSSFYKAFKTHTGMTPGEYKKGACVDR